MDPKTVKRIFLFFIIYLPIQYVLVGVVGLTHSEPWPAFVLPGFKSVYATGDQVEIQQARFIAYAEIDSRSGTEVEASSLFDGLPQSQLQGFLNSNFRGQTGFSRDAKRWLRNRLTEINPQRSYSELQVQWEAVTYSNNRVVSREKVETITIPLDSD